VARSYRKCRIYTFYPHFRSLLDYKHPDIPHSPHPIPPHLLTYPPALYAQLDGLVNKESVHLIGAITLKILKSPVGWTSPGPHDARDDEGGDCLCSRVRDDSAVRVFGGPESVLKYCLQPARILQPDADTDERTRYAVPRRPI
jgi:hypothetical protein